MKPIPSILDNGTQEARIIWWLFQRIARYRTALEAIKNSPGGGPGKRIAYQALEDEDENPQRD